MPQQGWVRTGRSGVRLTVLANKTAVYEHFAQSVADEIRRHNQSNQPTRLIMPVGPTGQYPLLAQLTNRERISWQNVHTFNMDEYLDWQGRPISPSHHLSFRGYMKQFFSEMDESLRIPVNQMWFPSVQQLDEISEQIARVGGIDTCYGGIGVHGHVAFNEAPISRFYQVTKEAFLASGTRIVPLAPETMVMNATRSLDGDFANFPPLAVTIGMRDIVSAQRIRIYCDGGAWQRTAIREALEGEPRVEYPVTLLQEHPDFEIIADVESVPRDWQRGQQEDGV